MKILVLNSGSSSIKFELFESDETKTLAFGIVEQIGETTGNIKMHHEKTNKTTKETLPILNHEQGLEIISSFLINSKIINGLHQLDAIGHRVVHGGTFKEPALIDKFVIKEIEDISVLAPLHNYASLAGIKAMREKAPKVPQIAVFDTAFHQSLPQHAYMYALPYDLHERLHIRKYGFHGTSHEYVSKSAAKHINKPINECNFISLHLGNGASAAAIKNGKSVDTSMGISPLEGLIMGTRSGDIDPAVLFYLARIENMDIKSMDTLLNKQSGLKGICNINDMREIISQMEHGNEMAKLAFDMFCYRVKKYVGSYFAVLGRVDAIIFTGGIGENASLVREKICENLEIFGISLHEEKNKTRSNNILEIHEESSKIKLLVVSTKEELAIAKLAQEMIKSSF